MTPLESIQDTQLLHAIYLMIHRQKNHQKTYDHPKNFITHIEHGVIYWLQS